MSEPNVAQGLGARVNELRLKLGKPALSNPAKQGAKKLQDQLDVLLAEYAAKTPEPVVVAAPPPPPPPPEPTPAPAPSAPSTEMSAEAKAAAEFKIPADLDLQALLQFGKTETIKACSERLLMHVHATDPEDKRSVALMYQTVLALVLRKFPKAHTTVECLRWYAVHMRADDKRLPQKRPRPPLHG